MKKQLTGTVVSTKSNKTIVVSTSRHKTHRLYRKQYTVTKSYHVHDEENKAQPGDTVVIEETRPVSKTKTWKLSEIVSRLPEKESAK